MTNVKRTLKKDDSSNKKMHDDKEKLRELRKKEERTTRLYLSSMIEDLEEIEVGKVEPYGKLKNLNKYAIHKARDRATETLEFFDKYYSLEEKK